MALPKPSFTELQALTTLLKNGKYAELEDKARQYTRQFPKVVGFYDLLSKAQIGQKNMKGTIRTLKKALKVKPDFVDGEYNLGVAYMNVEKVDEAVECFKNVIKQKSDYYQAYNNLGACYINQKKLEDGIDCYLKSYEVKPDFVPTLMTLGAKLRESKDYKESEKYLLELVQAEPKFAVGHYSLALTQIALDKKNEAKASLEAALEIQPDIKEVKEALAKLEA